MFALRKHDFFTLTLRYSPNFLSFFIITIITNIILLLTLLILLHDKCVQEKTYNESIWQLCAEDIENNDKEIILWNERKAVTNVDFQSSY